MRKPILVIFVALSAVLAKAQTPVSVSGLLTEADGATPLGYANAVARSLPDSGFVSGTVSGDDGRYTLDVPGGKDYLLEFSFLGYRSVYKKVYVGSLSPNLEIGGTALAEDAQQLAQVEVTGQASEVSSALDRKSYAVDDNIAQTGGSVLQAMQNLPGVTIDNGSVAVRGSDRVVVLIDGKQTALTGFGKATGLDNLPASAVERIEVINNPGAKYDANGNAGIINIITRKERRTGLNGKAGFTGGLGSLWERQANLPGIRPQYRLTPKLNPSASLNYRTEKYNLFFQGDYLYTETLNKNEFATRTYDNGEVIRQQLKRNRNTGFTTLSAGIDYTLSQNNTLTVSGLFGSEKIIDRGDQPFFNANLSERLRLWQFLEDELKTTAMATAKFAHAFAEPGHALSVGLNYTFHREDERYFYDNTLENSTGTDAFKLLSDEQVLDFTTDYVRPLRAGRLETGVKLRRRVIPTNMDFQPGRNSVLDSTAGGAATYAEWIPAAYATYVYETSKWEAELGLRTEYVQLRYTVNESHPVYRSNGYNYAQPFPNARLSYKLDDRNRVAFFANRRVDRPNEVDIRIFPKYDDAEIIKVGNPELRPQFTTSAELGYKRIWDAGSLYAAAFGRVTESTITRIATSLPESRLIYNTFQNAGNSTAFGGELVVEHKFSAAYRLNANASVYRNEISAFAGVSKYPREQAYTSPQQSVLSGNVKLNHELAFASGLAAQITMLYQAPDLIPQGKMGARYSVNAGVTWPIQGGKGQLSANATDLFNTLVTRREVFGNGFRYTADDYAESQVVRVGYRYSF